MKKIINLSMAALFSAVLSASTVKADEREMIVISSDIQALFLKEMRHLVDNLDELLLALSDGDFKEVSNIANIKMGFGHNRWQKMLDDGVPMVEIEAAIAKMRKKRAAGQGGHGGGGGIFGGRGMGQHMPAEVREMGQQMHQAAAVIADAAKAAGSNPGAKEYQAVISGIQEMTSVCSACHASYKIR